MSPFCKVILALTGIAVIVLSVIVGYNLVEGKFENSLIKSSILGGFFWTWARIEKKIRQYLPSSE